MATSHCENTSVISRLLNTFGFPGIMLVINLMSSCAMIDRNILTPAAESSRVPPLFKTSECATYTYDKTKINLFVKNHCEDQLLSLKYSDAKSSMNSKCPEDISRLADQQAKLRECAAYLEVASDKICAVHLSRIFGNRAVTNASLGIMASGAGIAGGLVSGVAANALSGSAGFLTADRSIFNEEIYRNYVAEAVIKEIIDNRKTLKDNILSDIVSNTSSSSGISGQQELTQRVLEYHNACSFYAGLTSLLAKAGSNEMRATDVRKNLNDQIAALNTYITNIKNEIKNKEAADPKAPIITDLKAKLNSYQDQLMAYITARNSIGYSYAPVPKNSTSGAADKSTDTASAASSTDPAHPQVKKK